MKPWHLMTAMTILLVAGMAQAAPGPDELVMSRTAQVLGAGGSGRYELEVTVTLEAGANVAAGLTALAVEETLPTGWVYESVSATPAPSTVNPIAGNTYQFVWVTLPNLASPFAFTYRLNYPTGDSGQVIVGNAPYRTNGGQVVSNTVSTPQNDVSCLKLTRSTPGYVPGQPVTVQVTLDSFCGEAVTALAVEETWPAGWTYVSSSGVGLQDGTNAPTVGAQGTLQFFWFSPIPAFPYTFTYVVKAPVSATGPVTMTGQSVARLSGPELRTPLLNSVLALLDTTPPVITLNGANPLGVECGAAYNEPGATAVDNIDGPIVLTISGSVNRFLPGAYTITYTATDKSGNKATATRTVNVVDTTAPVLSLVGPSLVTVECHTSYSESGATATDVCSGNLTSSVVISGTVDVNTPGDYLLTYTVKDSSNNTSTVNRTVRVVDTLAPTLTLNGSATMLVPCKGAYVEPGFTAIDTCGGSLNGVVHVTGAVNTSAPGIYTLVYSVSDPSGNAAAPATRTVTVTDTTAPVITLNGAASVTVACGQAYSEPGASALDACAGNLSGAVVITGSVNTSVPGNYVRTYRVSDPSGNAAAPVTRTVHVTDTVVPVIILNGASPLNVECGTRFTDPGAVATDACDGNVSRFLTVQGAVNSSAVGSYTLTYSAHDSSGNNAVSVTRTVNVTDTAAPVITLVGANPLALDCGVPFADPGASAFDACDGTVTVTSDAPQINTNYPATYKITYTAGDSHGHTATAVRNVVVGGPHCDYCPMTDIVILHPPAKILIPSNVPHAYAVLTSEVFFAKSADCLEGTIEVSYTVNGTEYVPTSDRANNFPITLLLAPGNYTMQAEATLVQTGQVIRTEKTFSVVAVSVGANGYPLAPFTTVTPDGTTFSNTVHANGFNRSIEMAAALCPQDGGAADDITMSVNYDGDATQTLTVKVPRAVVPCGTQALVTLTVSDTIEGLVGSVETPYFVPVPGGFIAGGLFFDVSILVATLPDIADGEPVNYAEIDNSVIAAHPVSISLSGLSFSPNLIPVFLSHPSSISPDATSNMNLLGQTADWTDDETMGFMVDGSTLYGQAISLSVFAPFEKEKVLTFSPDIEYGVIFGRAVVNKSIDKVFTVTNNGELRASGTASIVDDNGVFSLVGDGVYSLAPGQSFQLTVRFTPKDVKDYEGTLNFSGVPNTNLSVRILGTGTLGPKKFLSIIGCAPAAQNGSGGELLTLGVALVLLAAGRVRRTLRCHS